MNLTAPAAVAALETAFPDMLRAESGGFGAFESEARSVALSCCAEVRQGVPQASPHGRAHVSQARRAHHARARMARRHARVLECLGKADKGREERDHSGQELHELGEIGHGHHLPSNGELCPARGLPPELRAWQNRH